MKKRVFLMMVLVMLNGCANRTPYGECIGINDEEDPTKRYEYSARNIILAVIFSETIITPIYIVLYDLKCPVENAIPLQSNYTPDGDISRPYQVSSDSPNTLPNPGNRDEASKLPIGTYFRDNNQQLSKVVAPGKFEKAL